MNYKVFFVIIIMTCLLEGCTQRVKVDHDDIVSINNTLEDKYKILTQIETYIDRPTLTWNINVNRIEECNEIFYELVNIIKTENIYEMLKTNYSGAYFDNIEINMYTPDNELGMKYSSSYYKSGTTIYEDDEKNEIDNFTTWYIGEKIYIYN